MPELAQLPIADHANSQVVGEEGDQFVVEREQPFADGQSYGCRGECLADAVQNVGLLSFAAVHPFLVQHFPVLQHHDALDVEILVLGALQVAFHGSLHVALGLCALHRDRFPDSGFGGGGHCRIPIQAAQAQQGDQAA